jgi:hypothetical protein
MTNVRLIRQNLELLQQIISDSIGQTSPRATQPSHIKTPLRPHQLATIEAMRQKEISFQTGYRHGRETLYSKYAILGDRAGVGKTLTVLSHIGQMSTYPLNAPTTAPIRLHEESTGGLFSTCEEPEPETLFDSLLVVPYYIYRQWQEAIKNETQLKATFLKTTRDLDKDDLIRSFHASHITLISNTLLNPLMKSLKARGIVLPKWRRVFYDEADTIKIASGCIHPAANMTWYITSSYKDLVLADIHFSSYVFNQLSPDYIETLIPEIRSMVRYHLNNHPSIVFMKTESYSFFSNHLKNKHPLRNHLVVRCCDTFIDNSIELPPLIEEVLRCQAPPLHDLLEYVIPQSIKDMLNAGDIKGALEGLGVSPHTPTTLVEAVTNYKRREIAQLNTALAQPGLPETTAKEISSKIRQIEGHIIRIGEKMKQISKEVCSVCYEPPEQAVVSPCCSNIFCGSCILQWIVRHLDCPLCREPIHPNDLKTISSTPSTPLTPPPAVPTKMETLLKILEDNPEGKFLIFSRYENPLEDIRATIQGRFPIQHLQGNKDIIARQIAEFEKGPAKILLVNSNTSIAGMNIPFTSHIILLHKMGIAEEQSILGRSYRLGRNVPLRFIRLLHDRE